MQQDKKRNGLEWNRVESDKIRWGCHGMEWSGMGLDWMEWNGMG